MSRGAPAIFGTLPDGRDVPIVTLANGNGITATILAYGATLQSLFLPDRRGVVADVVLGHASVADYLAKPQYFGATIGRYANRLAGGRFVIDGLAYQAPINDGPNSLHGGAVGFDKVLWDVIEANATSVTLRHVSADGEQGYPGKLTVHATYTLDGDELTIVYRATTDCPTICNITNHSYWNLAGEGSAVGAMEHVLTIPAEAFLPTDAAAIPTGEFRAVAGTAFDFRVPRRVGDRVREAGHAQIGFAKGYDHNWVIGRAITNEQQLMGRLVEPSSGRGFELWSNQPGLQFYSGNFLDATSSGKRGSLYRQGDAIVLEPQLFPDTPNQPAFGSARLVEGQVYRNVMSYRFTRGP